MLRKLLFLSILTALSSHAQFVTIQTTQTTEELVNTILIDPGCGAVSNVTGSSFSNGRGYFTAGTSNFPFAEGIILRSGGVSNTGGPYSSAFDTSPGSGLSDADLDAILQASAIFGNTYDASFISFDFIPTDDLLSFNFLFASNEYGAFQCSYSDLFAFLLTDLSTNQKINIAVVPGTNVPVSVTKVRDAAYNTGCPSENADFFGSYLASNANAATAPISMRGMTEPMTAKALVIPGHTYRLKLVIADFADSVYDTAVFIEGGSLGFVHQCQKALTVVPFVDLDGNGVQNEDEYALSVGTLTYYENDGSAGIAYPIDGKYGIPVTDVTATFDCQFNIDSQYAGFYSVGAPLMDISYQPGGSNIHYIPVTLIQPYQDFVVELAPRQLFSGGFTDTLQLRNNGTASASGSFSFALPDGATATLTEPIADLEITSTSETETGFTYSFTGLQPGAQVEIPIQIDFNTNLFPSGTLTATASVTTANDLFSLNNTATLSQRIGLTAAPAVAGKTEIHGDTVSLSDFDADDYLYYVINFQNPLTTDARNITVTDVLAPGLDASTVVPLGSSHPATLERSGDTLVWHFRDANLPSYLENVVTSSGSLTFKVKPLPGYIDGTLISNTASISFDGKTTVTTNTASTQFATLSAPTTKDDTFVFYPNPAENEIYLNGFENASVRLTDMTGKTVLQVEGLADKATLDLSALAKGIYVVEVKRDGTKYTRKLLKQ